MMAIEIAVLLATAAPQSAGAAQPEPASQPAPPAGTAVSPPVATAPPAPPAPAASLTAAPVSAAPAATQSGDIVVSAPIRATPGDPLAATNAQIFAVTEKIDEGLVAPIALGYGKVVPRPVRAGLRHVLHNLKTPVLLLNNVLQFKPVGAAKVLARFAINSSIGLGGLIDVAASKRINLPYINNGFGYTLGYYGIKPGPYFFLPLVGPTTLRDAIGGLVDAAVNPKLIGAPFTSKIYTLGAGTVRSLDYRIEFDQTLKEFRESSSPYISERAWYLKKRQDEIDALKGRKAPASSEPEPLPSKP